MATAYPTGATFGLTKRQRLGQKKMQAACDDLHQVNRLLRFIFDDYDLTRRAFTLVMDESDGNSGANHDVNVSAVGAERNPSKFPGFDLLADSLSKSVEVCTRLIQQVLEPSVSQAGSEVGVGVEGGHGDVSSQVSGAATPDAPTVGGGVDSVGGLDVSAASTAPASNF